MHQKNKIMININTGNYPLEEAASKLKNIIKKNKDKDVLLLFSGGSAMAIIDHIHPKIISNRFTISVLDERFTFEKKKSNFAKLEHTTFFKELKERKINYIDPRPKEKETLEESAKRFDLALKHWHITNRDGIVITTVGIGPDGHTSGVLPMPENSDKFERLFLNKEKCAIGYEVTPEKNPHTKRITTTLTYIERHINHAVIYATGIQKKDALMEMIYGEENLALNPSQILRRVEDANLFTDISLKK